MSHAWIAITHLDEEPVQGLSLSEAVEKMRGRVGSDLKLTIRREGREPFDVTVTRAVIKIQSVRSRMEGEDIGYVRITSFSEQTSEGVERAVNRFKETAGEKLKGIVLDLRNNPGGLLDQSVKVSDAFLNQGEIVSTRARRAEDSERLSMHMSSRNRATSRTICRSWCWSTAVLPLHPKSLRALFRITGARSSWARGHSERGPFRRSSRSPDTAPFG